MLGEEEISRNENLNEDELDAAKEVFSNIMGAFSTSLGAQKGMPKLNFEVAKVNFLDESANFDLNAFEKIYVYSIKIGDVSEQIAVVLDFALVKFLNKDHKEPAQQATPAKGDLSIEEMRNIGLIMDVRLPLHVRIGSKRMLLKDVLTMDIGSVIELN